MATFDLEVEPLDQGDEPVALRFKTLDEPRETRRVRNTIGDATAWFSVAGVGPGGMSEPAYAVLIEDSSEGTAALVFGGIHGLRLVSEDDGRAVREPYLVLARDAVA